MDVDFQSWLLRSSFSLRICATSIITLAEKGIKYESMKQNLIDKSPLLLEMNPVLKRMIRELMTLLYCRTADYQALFSCLLLWP
ncbi:hypothetical protein NC652_012371 [Populus alba x Populus x berolinensis]|nr:hypothetical protein NC652_012371 [Populus alba x Populus x berolinensis]